VLFKFGLTFFKHYVCLGFFIIFCGFFKVRSGVLLHNRVATLVVTVDELQFVGVHSRGCFDSVYDSQL